MSEKDKGHVHPMFEPEDFLVGEDIEDVTDQFEIGRPLAVQMSLRLSADEARQLERAARDADTSVLDVIRRALRETGVIGDPAERQTADSAALSRRVVGSPRPL